MAMRFQRWRSRLVMAVTVLVVAGCALYFLLDPSPRVTAPAGREVVAGHLLIEQAGFLTKAYHQMLSLGWEPASITYSDGGQGDLLKTHQLVPAFPPAPQGIAFADAHWQLGGGNILGRYAGEQRNVVFFIPGLTSETCRKLNAILWQDAADAAPRNSGSNLQDWQQQRADVLELFAGRNRAEACVNTREGLYLYYKVVYTPDADALPPLPATPAGAVPPPAPTIPPAAPLPAGADPELKLPTVKP
jgi:hypothetical protein